MPDFQTKVDASNVSQPNAYTCQASCIAMALGKHQSDVMGIRTALENTGNPGDPSVMGLYLKSVLGQRYEFVDDASLNEIKDWLKAGEFLIVHGWFTNSGHVIGLDGVQIDATRMSYRVNVKDPWSEFDGASFSYNNPNIHFYDGFYSSYLIYATCVASHSYSHAAQLYRRGELNSSTKNAWVHRIKPKKIAAPVIRHLYDGFDLGLSLIKDLESCELTAYPDPETQGKPYTIGWGNTTYQDGKPVQTGDTITQDGADVLLKWFALETWNTLARTTPYWDQMSPGQKACLLSFSYNTGWQCGDNGFATLNRAIVSRDWPCVPDALMLYVNPGGRSELGLRNRRSREIKLWQQ